MTHIFTKASRSVPVDFPAVQADWRAEGFSFDIFRDPPGQEWNNFTHQTDEYVLVAEGKLEVKVGDETAICEPGDLVCIPRAVPHSLKTLSPTGSVWLYGYGHWNRSDR